MAKIVTLTPNPAVDIATHVDALVAAHKLRCGPVRRDPGGGGINVARVVHRLGGEVVAVYAAGGGSGNELGDLLDREGLRHRPVRVAAHTRESFNVTEDKTGGQYRFVLPGEPLSEGECNACISAVLAVLAPGDYLVASGSLPPGAPADFYARVIAAAKNKGAFGVVDTQGPPLKAVLDGGVHVLKASARELAGYLGTTPSGIAGWREALAGLVREGKADVAVVTLGADGAVLVSSSGAWHATVPKVDTATTVGAGDSFLGGLLIKLQSGQPAAAALRYASAAGTAALLAHGTGLCDPADVERLSAQVQVAAL